MGGMGLIRRYRLRLGKSVRDLGYGFVVRAEGGAFGIEGVELAKDFFESAFASGFLSTENAAAFALFAEIGLDGVVVAISDADELGREAVA